MLRAPLNHLLNQRADLRAAFARHAGKVGRLRVPPLSIDFMVDGDGWLASTSDTPLATVVIAPTLLPRLLLDDATARREVRLEGEPAFAADIARLLQSLDWDAEADLARVLGDVAAHRLVNVARQWFDPPRLALHELSATLAEYLQEEVAVLAPPPSIRRFLDDVDTTRDDLARLDQRIRLLE